MNRTNPEIFQRNFEALEARYPELAEKVKHTKVVNYQLFQQDGCMPNVRHTILGNYWYVGNLQQYFDTQWKGLELENVKFPVFLSFGLGYEIAYFLTKYGAPMRVQACMIIERDIELFVCALNVNPDLWQLFEKPNIHFMVGLPPEEIYLKSRDFFQTNLREMLFCNTVQPIFTESGLNVDKMYYLSAMGKFLEAIWASIQNFGNCPEDSLIGLENMLDNIKEIASNPGINMLYDKFKGKPAVVVATGPSLKKNIHLLKGIEDKALILSVDASYKLLLKNGIKPHMVTSLEREHEVQQFFDNIPEEECKDVYMTACPVLFNHVYESYNGPKLIAYRNFDHFKWLGIDKGILDIRLSSSNMAFTIAKALGCDPIILIGQDLAYGDDGETHATEVPFSSAGEKEFDVPGNIKDKVRTNDGWYGFLKAYEVDVAQYNGKCINCTEGGAYIQGTEVGVFSEAIEKYILESFNPLQIIKDGIKDFTPEQMMQDIEHLLPLFEKTEADLAGIINLCIEGANLDAELEIKELLQPRIKITKEYGDTFQKFLMHVVQSYHLSFEMQMATSEKNPKEWYMFIGDMANICLDSLIRSKEKIKASMGDNDGQKST